MISVIAMFAGKAVRKHARRSLQILLRNGLKPAPTSSEKSCGCSQAAK
jgi:hypothetical protein